MKSVLLTGTKKLELREVPKPEILHGKDVLLRPASVGVCGSDIHYFNEGRIGDQVITFPFSIGHECSAVVEKTGPEVKNLKPGDRVAVEPAISCGKCDQCLSGRRHTCRSLRFMGAPGQYDGCLSEYVIMPEENCFLLHGDMPLLTGALVEPLSIGAYAVKLAGSEKYKNVAILGSGPIGLSVLLALGKSPERKIFVTDKLNYRLEAARSLGAYWTGNPDEKDIIKEVGRVEPLQMDLVFECCGKQEALDQALDLLKPGAKLMIVGIPETDIIHFDVSKLRRKEITIQNVRRQNNSIPDAIRIAGENPRAAEMMITHVFNLEEAQKAFETVAGYKDGVIKAMIKLDR
ncbi:MAG: alcohol dehydrogenase catalytic domain-containing protein [Ignavibacteria bacterium]|nr:alcohol dehydrogenase catalytic domain-containing protein [Ignavibacteria bacterium]MCU7501448.1 alcohol dehydrogenase catalytic domain-containing protein [Ignavibacteria bacterium]MCU7516036.1 alcohol dehydrogenase catalytic domain-containing protein [Ignavibacteria bacterium]